MPSRCLDENRVAVEVMDHKLIAIPLVFADQDRDAVACVETKIVEDHQGAHRHARPCEIQDVLCRLINVHIDMNETESLFADRFQMIVWKDAREYLEVLASQTGQQFADILF